MAETGQDRQELQHREVIGAAGQGPTGPTGPPGGGGEAGRKAKTPSVRRACVACHSGKTRCSEQLPCQSCVKRGLAATCAYPDPDPDHEAHPIQLFAPPPMYATLQNTTQHYYPDYPGASTSALRAPKRPRALTDDESAAIRNYTRGDFFIGNNAPVRIDTRLPVRLTLGDGDQVHFLIGENIMYDMLSLYQIVHELAEQLTHNQKFAASLHAQTAALTADAAHAVAGCALRRFHTDLSNESFESELERTSAQTIIENQMLLHENKQLSLLLAEYQSTLDTIMSKFRNHALAAQRHELTLTRHYETLLRARETHSMSSDLLSPTEMAHVLRRLSHHLRDLLRSMAGEPPDASDTAVSPADLLRLLDECTTNDDWALDRESEIARLESENAQLRRLLHIDDDSVAASGIVLDPVRDDPARFVKVVPKRVLDGGERSPPPPPPPPPPPALQQDLPLAQGYLQGPAAGAGAGAALQRALDLQPGMRMGTRGQGRRSGIIGRGVRRGALVGVTMDGWQPPPPGPWQGPTMMM